MMQKKISSYTDGSFNKYLNCKIEGTLITIREIYRVSFLDEKDVVRFTKPHFKGFCDCGREVSSDLKNLVFSQTPRSCIDCRKKLPKEIGKLKKEQELQEALELKLRNEFHDLFQISAPQHLKIKPLSQRGWMC